MRITYSEAKELLNCFGGEDGVMVLTQSDGHSGKGLYAYHEDYPEDGASFLGEKEETKMNIQNLTEKQISLLCALTLDKVGQLDDYNPVIGAILHEKSTIENELGIGVYDLAGDMVTDEDMKAVGDFANSFMKGYLGKLKETQMNANS